MKRLVLLIVAAAAILAAAAVGSFAAGTKQGKGEVRKPLVTITLREGEGSFAFVDNEPKSPTGIQEEPQVSAGDDVTLSFPLTTRSKRHAGFLYAHCVAILGHVRFDFARFQCQGTVALAGGKLSISGLVRFSQPVLRVAITGGTGAYEGVTGSFVSRTNSDLDTFRLFR